MSVFGVLRRREESYQNSEPPSHAHLKNIILTSKNELLKKKEKKSQRNQSKAILLSVTRQSVNQVRTKSPCGDLQTDWLFWGCSQRVTYFYVFLPIFQNFVKIKSLLAEILHVLELGYKCPQKGQYIRTYFWPFRYFFTGKLIPENIVENGS